eukprot:4115923-Prorocentrum_lima.AAC.1
MAHTGQVDGLEDERPDDHKVRTEELFVPLEVQEEVKENLSQGWINPAAGLKCTPVTNKEVAESE